MESALTSLVALAMVITTILTVLGDVVDLGATTAENSRLMAESAIRSIDSRIRPLSVDTASAGGVTDLDLRVANDGRTVYVDYSGWDVIVQYEDASGPRVTRFPYSSVISNGTWTDHEFWIGPGTSTPEGVDPGLLNPGEEMVLRIRVSPEVAAGSDGTVSVTTPEGTGGSLPFSN